MAAEQLTLRTSRDDWPRWLAGLVVQVVVASVSTGVTNYFVMQVQVARLEERLEGQRTLWEAQHGELRKQLDELRDELKELRALRRAAQQHAAADQFGRWNSAQNCQGILSLSPYLSSAENRRNSFILNMRQRGPPRPPPAPDGALFVADFVRLS